MVTGQMAPILTEPVFIEKHVAFLEGVRRYAWTVRGRRWLSDAALDALMLRSSTRLPAINVFARIAVAQAGAPLIRKLARSASPIFFLTLTPDQFAVPLGEAAAFDTRLLGEWVSDRLSGLHWLGMIDAGYFSNFSVGGRDSTLGWHAHVLIWGATAAEIAALTAKLNASWHSLIPGSDVAVARTFRERGTLGRWWYLAKAPISESRVVGAGELVDDETGEVIDALRIKDRALRPRDAARVCELMADRSIADLLLAGGWGNAIRDRILRTAKHSLKATRATERDRLRTVLYRSASMDRTSASKTRDPSVGR
jgi:hypothetical protein